MMSVSLPGLLGSERSFTRSLNRLFGDLVSKSCLTLGNTVDCSPPAPLSVGFPRQEYWSGLSFPSAGDLPDLGMEPEYPTHVSCVTGGFFTTEPPEEL